MTATCTSLPAHPRVDFDEAVLATFCDRYGATAEAELAEILTRVETLLAMAGLQVEQGHLGGLRRSCEDLLPLAESVGMCSLQRATRGVLDCLTTGDPVALSACGARLAAMGRPETFRDWSTIPDNTVA
ncbi:MAG: hypothetical protein AAGE03_00585 [Pseudomonadota bacterium]